MEYLLELADQLSIKECFYLFAEEQMKRGGNGQEVRLQAARENKVNKQPLKGPPKKKRGRRNHSGAFRDCLYHVLLGLA